MIYFGYQVTLVPAKRDALIETSARFRKIIESVGVRRALRDAGLRALRDARAPISGRRAAARGETGAVTAPKLVAGARSGTYFHPQRVRIRLR